jgi:hypothetical protein
MNQAFSNFSGKCVANNASPAMLAELQNIGRKYSAGQSRVDSLNPSIASDTGSVGTESMADSSFKEKDIIFVTDASNISPRTAVKQTTFSPFVASVDAAPLSEHIENNQVSMSILRSLGIPTSYSSFERTFARRLHRASCEYAYRLACDPSRYPVHFNNVFKLTLRAAGTIERVKYSLEFTLSRSTKEPLSNWGVTYIHVGGAGTHYPRPPEEGGLSYQSPNSWAVTSVGPHKIGGSTIEEALTAEMLLRGVIGMDGQFYDAYDVEGYLAEKGIRLDPGANYAQIELPDEGSFSPQSSGTSSPIDQTIFSASEPFDRSNHSTYYPGLPNTGYTPSAPSRRSYAEPQTQTRPHIDERRSTAPLIGQQYGTMPMTDEMYAYSFQPAKKTRVTIDIGQFVEGENHHLLPQSRRYVLTCNTEMAMAGTCLMRAPGFRRKDVEIALRRAVVSTH